MMTGHTMVSKVEEYLRHRRKLGYRLKTEGALLLDFAQYADSEGYGSHLTTDVALRWVRVPKNGSPLYLARRLEVVRCFARHLAVFDALVEVPPKGILGPAHRRATPYIYSEAEIGMLIKACRELEPADGLRPHTYSTLFGLLSCTGLRISEALKLQDVDVDLERGVLTIRETKFHKSRLVPLHHSTSVSLAEYVRIRSLHWPVRPSHAFFVSEKGLALPYTTANYVFLTVRRKLGWDSDRANRRRIYDLRHTFATRRLTLWQERNDNVQVLLSALSTYMGHVKVSDTYWYLSGVPQLFAVTVEAFERYACAQKGGRE